MFKKEEAFSNKINPSPKEPTSHFTLLAKFHHLPLLKDYLKT